MGKKIDMGFDKKENMPESIMKQANNILKKLSQKGNVGSQTRIALKNYTYTLKVGEVELRVNGVGLTSDATEEAFWQAAKKLRQGSK